MQTGFNWLSVLSSSKILWTWICVFRFHKRHETFFWKFGDFSRRNLLCGNN